MCLHVSNSYSLKEETISNGNLLMRTICAIAFLVFTFCFLYFYQADILSVEQHLLSGGKTYYSPMIGAVLISFVLFLLQLGVYGLTFLYKRAHALTYFPSLLAVTVLTGMHISGYECSLGYWLWSAPVLLIIYVLVVVMMRKYQPYEQPMSSIGPFSRMSLVNLLTMMLMFLFVGIFSNHNNVFHYRMKMENLLRNGQVEKALEVGKNSRDSDRQLFLLRAYALAKKGELGNHLFEYPTVGGSQNLLPDGKSVSTLIFPEIEIRRFASTKAADEYRLCAYLLDKDLESFVKAVIKCYDLKSSDLPKHFREALTLYTHRNTNPVVAYHSSVLDADYEDFVKLCHSLNDKQQQESVVRDTYGNTYWYYYQYR